MVEEVGPIVLVKISYKVGIDKSSFYAIIVISIRVLIRCYHLYPLMPSMRRNNRPCILNYRFAVGFVVSSLTQTCSTQKTNLTQITNQLTYDKDMLYLY